MNELYWILTMGHLYNVMSIIAISLGVAITIVIFKLLLFTGDNDCIYKVRALKKFLIITIPIFVVALLICIFTLSSDEIAIIYKAISK